MRASAPQEQALAAAYLLVDDVQRDAGAERVDQELAAVAGTGWDDVVAILHFAGLVLARGKAGRVRLAHHAEGLRRAADASGLPSLLALSFATDSFTAMTCRELSDELVPLDAVFQDVARAVALLDEETDDAPAAAVHRAAAYIECANCYATASLWELEEQMYLLATAALDAELPAALHPVREVQRLVVNNNRLDAAAVWAGALMELGLRDDAAARAARSLPPASGLDEAELGEYGPLRDAQAHFLCRLAGQPSRRDAQDVAAALGHDGERHYRGLVVLAEAVRCADQSAVGQASDLAQQALGLLSTEFYPQLRTLAMRLVVHRDPLPEPVLEYLQTLTTNRWQDRLATLGFAQARLEAERTRRETARLERHAYADELTGLANRRAYSAAIAELVAGRPEHPVSVVLLDVDHFKTVNDSFGHAVGDDVLRTLAEIVQSASRATDVVARLGGDEFVVLVPGEPVAARRIASRVVTDVAAHDWSQITAGLAVSVSVGVATGPAVHLEQTQHRADEHLYEAKASGRGRVSG